MGFPGPIVRYAPPFIIEISIFTRNVRIRACPPSASRAASSYPAASFHPLASSLLSVKHLRGYENISLFASLKIFNRLDM